MAIKCILQTTLNFYKHRRNSVFNSPLKNTSCIYLSYFLDNCFQIRKNWGQTEGKKCLLLEQEVIY